MENSPPETVDYWPLVACMAGVRKTPFLKTPFPFPFKRLPRRLGPLLIQSTTVCYSIFIETPDSRFHQTANVNLYHMTKFSP